MIELSNKYFNYLSPTFRKNVERVFDVGLSTSFAMHFLGCDEDYCEFSWIPFGEDEQSFTGRGTAGKPLVDFTTNFVSHFQMPIPLESMVTTVNEIVEEDLFVGFMMSQIGNITVALEPELGSLVRDGPSGWRKRMGTELGINCDGEPVSGHLAG